MNWCARTHDGHSSEAQSKHFATARDESFALHAVHVTEFQPLFSISLDWTGASIMCSVDEKSLKSVWPCDGGDSRQSALQTGHPLLSRSSVMLPPSLNCCLSQQIWQSACRHGNTLGSTEKVSPTPQTAHLVASPGLDTPLLDVLELHPGSPPLGGLLLVPLLPMLDVSYIGGRDKEKHVIYLIWLHLTTNWASGNAHRVYRQRWIRLWSATEATYLESGVGFDITTANSVEVETECRIVQHWWRECGTVDSVEDAAIPVPDQRSQAQITSQKWMLVRIREGSERWSSDRIQRWWTRWWHDSPIVTYRLIYFLFLHCLYLQRLDMELFPVFFCFVCCIRQRLKWKTATLQIRSKHWQH